MLLSSLLDFCDDFQEFCYIIAHLLKLPEVLHYIKAMNFPAVRLPAIAPKDSDLNELNVWGSASNRDEFDVTLQSTNTSYTLDVKKLQKTWLQYLRTSATVNLSGSKLKKHPFRYRHEFKTSTPQYGCHTMQTCKICSEQYHELKSKVQQLEQEVIFLRKQVADMLAAHPGWHMMINKHFPELPIVDMSKSTPTQSTQPVLPPPPPPPPPPPLLQLCPQNSNISKVPAQKAKVSRERGKENNARLDMVAVLRGMKDVKLRYTEKSPGGTPARRPKLISNPGDPENLLCLALKKRFASIHPQETEDKDSSDSSWYN